MAGYPHAELTEAVIGAAIEVHRQLGPGLLESAYESCLAYELGERRIGFERQVEVPVTYKNAKLDAGYRIDLLVQDLVIVELKSVEEVLPIHHAQLLTYMKLAQKPIWLLINFNVDLLKNGLTRRVL